MFYALALHGNFGSPTDWDGAVRALRARFPGATFDAPSLWSLPTESVLENLTNRIQGARRAGRRVFVIGYSLGARLALEIVARGDVSLDGVVLCSVNPGLTDEDARAERIRSDELWVQKVYDQGLPWEALIAEWNSQPVFNRSKGCPAVRFTSAEEERIVRNCIAAGLRAWSLGRLPPRWSVLQSATVPVLTLVGELDEKFCRLSEDIKRLGNPQIVCQEIPAAGHRILLDEPEQVGERIAQFVSSLR